MNIIHMLESNKSEIMSTQPVKTVQNTWWHMMIMSGTLCLTL